MLMKNRFMNHCIVVSALMFAASAAPADETTSSQNARVRVTDFSGRPPFSRRDAPADASKPADFARFQELNPAQRSKIGEGIRVADYRGRPPYRRSLVALGEPNVVEFARFEEVTAPAKRRRAGPPGKGFRRLR